MRGKGEGEVPNRAEKQRKKAVGVDDSHNKVTTSGYSSTS